MILSIYQGGIEGQMLLSDVSIMTPKNCLMDEMKDVAVKLVEKGISRDW
jgi:hypothetical protein